MATPPIRTVLVGCGGITGAWLGTASAREDFELVGIVDLQLAAAEALRERHGLTTAAVGSDLAEMLATTEPEAVFDCTVPAAHPVVGTTALQAGCHVLSEKPLAENLADARRLVALAAERERVYAVIQNRRYLPSIRRLRAFLDSGALGEIRELHADFFIPAHFGGFREAMPHVLLWDMAIHSFDQGRFLAGRDPTRVSCHEWNPPGSWYQHGANALALFEFADGGRFSYRGSWTTTGRATSWECSWRIVGTRGCVTWDGGDGFHAEALADPDQPSGADGGQIMRELVAIEVPAWDQPDYRRGHDGLLHDFARALRGGPKPETAAADNLASVAMVAAAVASAEADGAWMELGGE